MNFPMQYPIYQFLYWLINTPGIGSVVAVMAGIGSITAYFFFLRSIRSVKDEGRETYTYPTPTLHQNDKD